MSQRLQPEFEALQRAQDPGQEFLALQAEVQRKRREFEKPEDFQRGLEEFEERHKELIEERFGRLVPFKTRKRGPAKSFKVEGTKAIVGFIPSVSEHFCGSCNRLRLTSDGKLRLCLMRDKEIDLKSILRSPYYSREILREIILKALVEKRSVNGIEALKSLGCQRKMFTIGG